MSQRRIKRRAALIESTRIPASHCPNCGKRLDAATGASFGNTHAECERPYPYPGAATICAYCSRLLVFDAQLRLRLPSPGLESRILAENPLLADMQRWRKSEVVQ